MTINYGARQRLINLANIIPEDKLQAAVHILESFVQDKDEEKSSKKYVDARTMIGKYSHLSISTDKMMMEKQKDIELEEEKYRRHFSR